MLRVVVLSMLVFVLAAAPARALDFHPCAGTPDYECATLAVPLDPAAPAGEPLALEVRRLRETSAGAGALVALAGGPGQGSTDFIDDFAGILAAGLVDRQLIVLDQRGTGRSGALTCPALAGGVEELPVGTLTARVARCGEELGARRRFYTTTEVVADLEALRVALGVERLSIFGVSYGAYVAQRYARAYPGRVDRLVLDSPVAQDQGGPFDASSYVAAARVLRGLCARRRCPGVRDVVADVRRLIARLPLRGRAYDAHGRRVRVRLRSAGELFDLLVSSDFSPALRAALPGAIAAAVRGDRAPLLRLVLTERADAGADAPEEFSDALFFATTCSEKPQAWGSAAAPLAGRAGLRAAALPPLAGPFGRAAAASTQVGTAFCLAWPPTAVAPPPTPAVIDAQALILSGTNDLRTPWEEARRTTLGIHDGMLVRVPGAGHAVVSQGIRCVQTALSRFFRGSAVGNPCDGRTARGPRPAPVPPRHRRPGGRALSRAVAATLGDAVRTAAIFGPLSSPVRAGGLRGGSFCASPGTRGRDGRRPLRLRLRRVRYVPGLAVTGTAVVTRGHLTGLSVRTRGRHLGLHAIPRARRTMPPLTVPAAIETTGCV